MGKVGIVECLKDPVFKFPMPYLITFNKDGNKVKYLNLKVALELLA